MRALAVVPRENLDRQVGKLKPRGWERGLVSGCPGLGPRSLNSRPCSLFTPCSHTRAVTPSALGWRRVRMTKAALVQLTAQPARASPQPTWQAAATESEAVGLWVTSPTYSPPAVTVMTKRHYLPSTYNEPGPMSTSIYFILKTSPQLRDVQ